MIRKHLALALAMVVASGGAAVAASRPSGPDLPIEAIVRTFANSDSCGANNTLVPVPNSRFGYLCTHTQLDAYVPPTSVTRTSAAKPALAKVPCYGDGTTGPRIQFIYGYYDGLPNRAKTVTAQVRTQMAPRMQAVIKAQSLGRDLGLRFAMTKGCGAVDVKVVEFPESVQFASDPMDPQGQFGRLVNYLDSKGFNRADRKYQVLWDGFNGASCGISSNLGGLVSAPASPISDGVPTLGGRSSLSVRTVVDQYSMIFNHALGPKGPSCFDTAANGASHVVPQIHELFHTLGAVARDAPHSDRGHCTDAPSIMCPGQGAGAGYGEYALIKACAKVLVQTLDCGMDDYWNPSPEVGSYLFDHHNIAKSQFFGPQPADLLVDSPL